MRCWKVTKDIPPRYSRNYLGLSIDGESETGHQAQVVSSQTPPLALVCKQIKEESKGYAFVDYQSNNISIDLDLFERPRDDADDRSNPYERECCRELEKWFKNMAANGAVGARRITLLLGHCNIDREPSPLLIAADELFTTVRHFGQTTAECYISMSVEFSSASGKHRLGDISLDAKDMKMSGDTVKSAMRGMSRHLHKVWQEGDLTGQEYSMLQTNLHKCRRGLEELVGAMHFKLVTPIEEFEALNV